MKYQDMPPEEQASARAYIDSRWRGMTSSVDSTKSVILNYLFTLNAGGLAAALAYLASRHGTWHTTIAIVFFALGLLAITVRAALDYYGCEECFGKFRNCAKSFYQGDSSWDDVTKETPAPRFSDCSFHLLGWASGLAFILALGFGLWGILSR